MHSVIGNWRSIFSWMRFPSFLVLVKYCLKTSSSLFIFSINFCCNSLSSCQTICCSWGNKRFTLWFLRKLLIFFSFFFISNVPRRELNKSHFWSKYVFPFLNKLQLTFKYNDPSFHIFFIFLLPSYMRLNDICVRNQVDRLDELSFCCLSHFLVSISSFILNLFRNSLFHRSGSVSFAFVFSFYIIVFINGRV